MRLRFIILVLLALLITAGFVGAVSATDPVITLFEPDKESVSVDDNVKFTWSATNATSYSISYNTDETSVSAESGVTHKFTSKGTYIVTLTAKNNTATPATKSVTITVSDAIIKKVEIVGINEPRTGETPDTSGEPKASNIDVGAVSWTPAPKDNKFEIDKEYTASLTVTTKTGYVFDDDTKATINGYEATISDRTASSMTISYKFSKTTPAISSVILTITAPKTGNTPEKVIKSSTTGIDASKSTVTWDDNDDKFIAGEDYTATIIVPTSDGYTYATSPKVYLNDKELASTEVLVTDNGKKIQVIHEFTNDISDIYITIEEPAAGQIPETTAKSSDKFVTIKSVSWSPSVSTFAQGTTYTVTMNVALAAGLEYADEISFYINDLLAPYSSKSDGTYDVSGTFTTANEIYRILITLNNPVIGGYAQKTARIESEPYNAVQGTVSWNPSVSTFAADTVYTAKINVNTYSRYKFVSDVTATVNGDKATVTEISDSSVTVSYTYPKTAGAHTDAPTPEPIQTETTETTSSGDDMLIPNPISIIQELVKLFLSMFDFNNYVMAETPAVAEQ